MFRVGRGTGSRVLLRTSMVKHLSKSPRECLEMAADIAAYFSGSRYKDRVEVTYTKSKDGGGRRKFSDKLGRIFARPHRVEDKVREVQEEQGYLGNFAKKFPKKWRRKDDQ